MELVRLQVGLPSLVEHLAIADEQIRIHCLRLLGLAMRQATPKAARATMSKASLFDAMSFLLGGFPLSQETAEALLVLALDGFGWLCL